MSIIDSYSEANQDDTLAIGVETRSYGGQSFTGLDATLTSVQFYLRKSGSPTGNATVRIYAHTGTFGVDGLPTGSPIATSDNFDVSALGPGLGLHEFVFSGGNQILLANGTKYFAILEFTDGNDTDHILFGYDGSSSTHGGNMAYSADASSWTVFGADGAFYVNGTLVVAGTLMGQVLT